MPIIADYPCPTCATDCGNTCPPPFITNDCQDAFQDVKSELCTWLYSCVDENNDAIIKPADWTSISDWKTAISNGLTKVNIVGSIPEPTQESREISKGRIRYSNKEFSFNFTIDEWSQANYDAMRALECGFTMRFWAQAIGGPLLGGPDGILADISKINSPWLSGSNQHAQIIGAASWEHRCAPEATTLVELL